MHEEDHALLVAALREDPSGQTVVLEAQRAAAGSGSGSGGGGAGSGGGTGATAGAPTASVGGAQAQASLSGSGTTGVEETRPVRLRRLLARLLPPNPFSSGPKAEAAMKLAAWIAAVSRDAEGGSVSAASHLGGAGDLPAGGLGLRRPAAGVAAAAGPSLAAAGGAAAAAAAGGAEAMDADDDGAPGAGPKRRKRHKPLSELLAEIPLQEPLPADRPGQHPVPAAEQLQQLLAGGGGGGGAAAGGAAAGDGQPGAGDPLGEALGLLLQQHLQQQQAAGGEAGGAAGGEAGMDLDDALMLRALDAQVGADEFHRRRRCCSAAQVRRGAAVAT